MKDVREDNELTDLEKKRRDKAMNDYNSQMLEKEIHAEKRAAKGKDPKVLPGQRTKEEHDRKVLGGMVDNIIGAIHYTETIMDQKMFFHVSVPLKDGRVLEMRVDNSDMPQQG